MGKLCCRQLSSNALEELIDDHTGGSAHHTLSNAGDRAAGADISRIVKQRARVVGNELNPTVAFNKSRRAAAIHCHLVFRGGLEIVKADRSTEDPADRANTEPQFHVIGIIAGLEQLLATRKTLSDAVRIGEKAPNRQGCDAIKCELPLNLHTKSPSPTGRGQGEGIRIRLDFFLCFALLLEAAR